MQEATYASAFWKRHPDAFEHVGTMLELGSAQTNKDLADGLTLIFGERVSANAVQLKRWREHEKLFPRWETSVKNDAGRVGNMSAIEIAPDEFSRDWDERGVKDAADFMTIPVAKTHVPEDRSPNDWEALERVARNARLAEPPAASFDVGGWLFAPTAIAFLSDLHIGAKYTDYDAIARDVRLLAAAPNVKVVLGGDVWHNHKTGRGSAKALYDTLADPDEQGEWSAKLLRPIFGKIAGVVSGNHEFFDNDLGRDVLKEWCKRHRLPYWGHGGTMAVTAGSNTYYGAIRHSFAGNLKSAGDRVYGKLQRPREAAALDFIVMGHLHENLQLVEMKAGGECHYLRSGAYLSQSDYAKELFGTAETFPGVPIVILYPKTRQVVSFAGNRLPEAMRFLAMEAKGA